MSEAFAVLGTARIGAGEADGAATLRPPARPPGAPGWHVQVDIRSWGLGASRWIVALSGELDISNGGAVEEALAAAALQGTEAVILDARGLTFLDVAGLRACDRGCARCRRAGSRVSVLLRRDGGPARLVLTLMTGRAGRRSEVLTDTSIHLMAD